MDLKAEHIASKKKVGNLKGKPVIELVTTGGLHLVVAAKNGSFETLGTGPHRAVARHIAMKRESEITWSELNKADHVDVSHFESLLPRYEQLTDEFRKSQGTSDEQTE